MYDSNKYLMALVCWKTNNCTDNPFVVIIGKDQTTRDVFRVKQGDHLGDIRNHINEFDGMKYNGIPSYDVTISEKEYHDRFMHLYRCMHRELYDQDRDEVIQ